MATGAQYRTLVGYRADQREKHPTVSPLADYDPAYAARIVCRGVPRDWLFCTCGSDKCPDKGAA